MLRVVASLLLAMLPPAALASDPPEFTLTIQNHRFNPSETTIPADTKVKLIVVNRDATPEEFESHELNREKVVAGNASINVYVGPLKAGRYPYFGDFNQATAQGVLIAR